jgi:hypothetical protein
VAVDDRDFGLLQKLRKLPHVLESIEVFAVVVLFSVDMSPTLAALPLLPGRTMPRASAEAVAELGNVVNVPLSFRNDVGPSGNCSTEDAVEASFVLVGMVHPATASSASLSLETAMLSLLGFFLAFLLSDPNLLAGALEVRKVGGD